MNKLRKLIVLACSLLLLPTTSLAQDDMVVAESRYTLGHNLGTAGMITGYSGPVLIVGGVVIAGVGLLNSGAGAVEGDAQAAQAGAATAVGGVVVLGTGFVANTVGPALLATGSMMSASGIVMGGGEVKRTAGWVAVGGSAVQILSMAGRFTGAQGMGAVGALGWGTAMIAGTVQHVKNRNAWETLGVAAESSKKPRVQLALLPTPNGGVLHGTF